MSDALPHYSLADRQIPVRPAVRFAFGDNSLYCMMGSAHVQIIASALPEFMSAVFRF